MSSLKFSTSPAETCDVYVVFYLLIHIVVKQVNAPQVPSYIPVTRILRQNSSTYHTRAQTQLRKHATSPSAVLTPRARQPQKYTKASQLLTPNSSSRQPSNPPSTLANSPQTFESPRPSFHSQHYTPHANFPTQETQNQSSHALHPTTHTAPTATQTPRQQPQHHANLPSPARQKKTVITPKVIPNYVF
ncbi:hypothetical protein BDU57DRAFT_147305 [Ampelomyces quisqualis]|uniref:Uncharacterized protein n=1 Tax=Ampelomyces quisqualis TaxID=50730 RepID=A0A6A5QV67_AMPQU|nr:hypothetical protein BDU57DRAFT_147305 [Ampelomyces quisqualis]